MTASLNMTRDHTDSIIRCNAQAIFMQSFRFISPFLARAISACSFPQLQRNLEAFAEIQLFSRFGLPICGLGLPNIENTIFPDKVDSDTFCSDSSFIANLLSDSL